MRTAAINRVRNLQRKLNRDRKTVSPAQVEAFNEAVGYHGLTPAEKAAHRPRATAPVYDSDDFATRWLKRQVPNAFAPAVISYSVAAE